MSEDGQLNPMQQMIANALGFGDPKFVDQVKAFVQAVAEIQQRCRTTNEQLARLELLVGEMHSRIDEICARV